MVWTLLPVCTCLYFFTIPLWAASPDLADVSERVYRLDGLFAPSKAAELQDLPLAQAAPYRARLTALGLKTGSIDLRTGRFQRLTPVQPLLPGAGAGNTLNWAEVTGSMPTSVAAMADAAEGVLLQYLQSHSSELEVDIHELGPASVVVHLGGDVIQLHFPRQVQGIEVRGSFINAVINSGNLVLLGIHGWGLPAVNLQATVTAEAAMATLDEYLAPFTVNDLWGNPELVLVPVAPGNTPAPSNYRLAWSLRPEVDDVSWEGLIDAHSGTLLAFQSDTQFGSATTRHVQGGVLPYSNDGSNPGGVEHSYPMPYADVTYGATTAYADGGGNIDTCVEGTATTRLQGSYVLIQDDCGPIEVSSEDAILDLGLAPSPTATDCTVGPNTSLGNTLAARTAYYELNKISEMARSHLPNLSFLARPLSVTVNGPNPCQASSSANGLAFHVSTLACRNTGEIATLLDHEWVHSLDRYDATPGVSNPGEGLADFLAVLRHNTSCVGEGYARGVECAGEGDACTDCDGLRDLDYAKHASGLPHDLDWVIATCTQPGGSPCGGGIYCESTVYAEALYDLLHRDLPTIYGMSADTAREVVTRLTLIGAGGVSNWFQCSTTNGGCNGDGGYLNLLAADDDDGDLNNGTPHMAAIFAAFDRHQIACGSLPVLTSGCNGQPTQAPTLSTTAQDRAVQLTWTAVPGAVAYRVFRSEGVFGCDGGKTWITETSATSFRDQGLANGFEYAYVVAALGNGDSCLGPTSACAIATPVAQTRFDVAPEGVLLIQSGDGDTFLDNCESAQFQFDVWNTGATEITNLEIVGLASPSHPGLIIATTLPSSVSTQLASGCTTVSGLVELEGNSLDYGDQLTLEITLQADGLDAQTFLFQLGAVESDWAPAESLHYDFEASAQGWIATEGGFEQVKGQGNDGSTGFLSSSALLANACDRMVSPLLRLYPNSTLTVATRYAIEDGGSVAIDRANLALFNPSAGTRSPIAPDGGRPYLGPDATQMICLAGLAGFSGTEATWAASSWSATALGAAGAAGLPVQLELRYATNGDTELGAFFIDDVALTQVDQQVPDQQTDGCQSCVTLNYDRWPEATVLAYVACLNQVP